MRYEDWHKRLQEVTGTTAEVLVSKQRHGPIGKVWTWWFAHETTRFENLIGADRLPDGIH